jgi:5-hydroxyisourate hydrolase-like protein (transthyretin family)
MILTIAVSFLLLSQVTTPQEPEQAKASLEGRVLHAGTNQPVEGAKVILNRLPATEENWDESKKSAQTDKTGSFLIEELKPGSYMASMEWRGSDIQLYGARGSGETALFQVIRGVGVTEDSLQKVATVLKVEPGKALRNIDFHLPPPGVVTGRILGLEGRPLVNVRVRILPDRYNAGGSRILAPLDVTTATDDRGEFRLLDVGPGRYYLVAQLRGNEAPVSRYRTTTFYPGMDEASRASTIEVTAGQETHLSTFRLLPRPQAFTISGRVHDERTQPKPDSFDVAVVSRQAGATLEFDDLYDTDIADDGTFRVEGVPPGSYWIAAYSSSMLNLTVLGVTPMEVVRSDVDRVPLRLVDPVSIAGKIRFDEPPQPQSGADRIHIGLELPEIPLAFLLFVVSRSAEVKADGTFSIAGLFPGEFRAFAADLPPDMYVKDIRFRGADALNGLVGLTGPTTDALDVLIGTKGGQLRGKLLDEQGNPASEVEAVLIPQGDDPRPDYIKTAYSDASGRFTLRGIAPGDYTLLAWQKPEGSYFNPDFVRRFAGVGRVIRISEGSEQTIDVPVIR